MKYLLDSNIFIEPKKQFYVFDLCPDFWTWIRTSKDLTSIEEVREEIFKGDDELVLWMKQFLKKEWFIKTDTTTQKNYNIIADYVNALEKNSQRNKDTFLNGADGWLIATAMKQNDIIVTLEKSHPATNNGKIYLPDVAKHFNVNCIMLCDLLRAFKISFVFESEARKKWIDTSCDEAFHLVQEIANP